MSRPKKDCYGYMMMRIKKYPAIKEEKGLIPMLQWNAIEKELEKIKDDEPRMKAVQMVLIRKTHTIEGAAQVLHYSYWTVQKWISRFVNEVAKNSGF